MLVLTLLVRIFGLMVVILAGKGGFFIEADKAQGLSVFGFRHRI